MHTDAILKNVELKYKYGVYANTEKYGMIVVPILGLYYLSSNQKFEMNASLPIMADANYKLYPKIGLGMRVGRLRNNVLFKFSEVS
tara:strand:+ start:9668 stop:9925 length:258 start_codon:yes stop_codon:yes gene_type:complete